MSILIDSNKIIGQGFKASEAVIKLKVENAK